MVALSDVRNTGRRIVATVTGKNVTLMAAGIAYNAFVSLAPALLLVVFVVSVFGGGLEERLLALARDALPGPVADLVAQVLGDGSAFAGVSAVGLVVLLWGALKVFRGLDTAFSEIYGTESTDSFVDQLRDGAVVLVALVATTVTTVGLSAVFASFSGTVPLVGFLTPLVMVAVLVVALFPMYYYFPDTDLEWREVLPGVVFAAVTWAVLQGAFQVYLAVRGDDTGSFFGGILVVVTWLYFSGLVLLVGAVVNAVLGDHAPVGDRASTARPGDETGTNVGASPDVEASPAAGSGTDATPERHESLDRDELATYLRGLHDDLTEPPESAATDGVNRYGRPTGGVELVERTSSLDDGREWAVELRWRTRDGRDESSHGDD